MNFSTKNCYFEPSQMSMKKQGQTLLILIKEKKPVSKTTARYARLEHYLRECIQKRVYCRQQRFSTPFKQ